MSALKRIHSRFHNFAKSAIVAEVNKMKRKIEEMIAGLGPNGVMTVVSIR